MEELFFINTGTIHTPRRLFVHALFNSDKMGVFVLLLNPFLDRIAAFSVQRTQVEIARALHAKGINTLHIDYYGTGDSGGELYEIDFQNTINDINKIVHYVKKNYSPSKIILFGLRFGADVALHVSQTLPELDTLILYEPVVNGNYFYKEKKYIVKANHLLWNINPETEIEIDSKPYEDFDGIPISTNLKNAICAMKSDELEITGRNILVFNLDTSNQEEKPDSISNKKHIKSLIAKNNQKNRIKEVVLNLAEGQDTMVNKTIAWIVKFVILVESTVSIGNRTS